MSNWKILRKSILLDNNSTGKISEKCHIVHPKSHVWVLVQIKSFDKNFSSKQTNLYKTQEEVTISKVFTSSRSRWHYCRNKTFRHFASSRLFFLRFSIFEVYVFEIFFEIPTAIPFTYSFYIVYNSWNLNKPSLVFSMFTKMMKLYLYHA